MTKKGSVMKCATCGVMVECVEGCGCRTSQLVCCGSKMKKSKKKKVTKKKTTKKKKKR